MAAETKGDRPPIHEIKPEPSIILEGIVVLLAAASMAQAASQLIAQAKDLALAWVKDHQAVPPDEADTVLGVVGRYADSALFDRFQAEAKKAENLADRQRLIVALGLSKDPRLERKALDALAAHAFQPVDSLLLLFVLSMHAETRSLTYDYLKQRYDAVVAALPSDALFGYLPKTAEGFDTPDRQSDVESFFKDKDVRLTGGPRIIAQVVESIRLNAAFKQAQLPSLSELLRTQ
jgi:alanyl aminopeptidase